MNICNCVSFVCGGFSIHTIEYTNFSCIDCAFMIFFRFLYHIDMTLPRSSDFVNGFMVRNKEPSSDWTGRAVNVALFKGERCKRPLVGKQCSVKNYVTLTDTQRLYFGVMIPAYSIAYEYHFKSTAQTKRRLSYENIEFTNHDLTLIPDAEFSKLEAINLQEFEESRYIEIVLTEDETSGKLTFRASGKRTT